MFTRSEQHTAPRQYARQRLIDGLCVAVVMICALLILTFRHGRDQAIYTVVARTLLEGGMPYRDAWDFKPPGIFLVYALARALFGSAPWGVRVLEVAGLLGTVAGMMSLTKRLWGEQRIGLLAGAMTALVHAQLEFWHSAQPETFGGMLSVAGLWIALHRKLGPRTRWLLAGIVFGMAGLLKPPLAGGGAVLALWLGLGRLRAGRDYRIGRHLAAALAPVWWILLGGVSPWLLTLLWFGLRGALPQLHHTLLVFTPHYTLLGWHGQHLLSLLYRAVAEWLLSFCSLLSVGLLCLLLAGRQVWRKPGVSLLAGMVAMQLLGVALQAKFFPYHFAGIWPLTALLAALGLSRVWQWLRRKSGGALWAQLLFASGLLLASTLRTATKDLYEPFHRHAWRRLRLVTYARDDRESFEALSTLADVNAIDNRRMADELARRLPAGTPVLVWGFEPQLYDMADMRAATRFIYNVPQRVPWASAWGRAELMADLAATPPEAIVVLHGDALPMVTGDGTDSAQSLQTFNELAQLITRDYAKLKSIGDLDLYLRRPAEGCCHR